jgi:hypothetical protein
MLRPDEVPADDIPLGAIGKMQVRSRVVEVQRNGGQVFDVSVTPNNSANAETCQLRKMDRYTAPLQYTVGESKGQRKGELRSTGQTTYNLPNFFILRITLIIDQLHQQKHTLFVKEIFSTRNKPTCLERSYLC